MRGRNQCSMLLCMVLLVGNNKWVLVRVVSQEGDYCNKSRNTSEIQETLRKAMSNNA